MHLIKLNENKNIIPPQNMQTLLDPDYVYIPISINNFSKTQILAGEEVDKHIYSPVSGRFVAKSYNDFKYKNKVHNDIIVENDFREYKAPSNLKKLKKASSAKYSQIVINCIDDEPYTYNKSFLLKENLSDLLKFIDKISLDAKSHENLLVVKASDAAIIESCLAQISTYPNIKLIVMPNEYLLGRKEFLLKKLKITDNYLYLDINILYELMLYNQNRVADTKIITISGDDLKESIVVKTKLYVPLRVCLEKFVGNSFNDYDIIAGGIMSGYKVNKPSKIIIDNSFSGVYLARKTKEMPGKCIKCGRCLSICPMKVNMITKENIDKCINCNLCSYICPVKLNPLTIKWGDSDA